MADESVEQGGEQGNPGGVQYQSATAVKKGREKEVLTPELVEDEVARNDFVIRWMVVLMAFLYGCTDIRETQTLVHIRAGEVIADNGGWAPEKDVLSSTASERSWVNLGWGFDLLTAGLFGVAGFGGLSLFKALCAALTFYLVVHISRPGVSSWWGSILAALAVLACYPQFTMRPEIITLLGTAILLTMLFRVERTESNAIVWQLPVLFLLWTNLDPNAWVGLLLLVLFVVGEFVGKLLERSRLETSAFQLVAAGTGLSVVAMCIHRFSYQTLLAPMSNFGRNQALMFDGRFLDAPSLDRLMSFPLFDEKVMGNLSHTMIAAFVLCGLCVVALGLNARRLRMGDAFLFIGAVGLSAMAVHELAIASLVFTVVATLNAQEWYQASFRQEYSTDFKELLFMRGGRAITVLCVFAIGFLFVSGWINGAGGRRSGFGLENRLAVRAEAYVEDLKNAPDEKPFHFTLSQGDLLIWAKKKSFADSRITMFVKQDDDAGDILQTFDDLRESLIYRKPEDQANYPQRIEKFEKEFTRWKVRYVVPPTTRQLGLAFRGLYMASLRHPVGQNKYIKEYFAPMQVKSLAIFLRTTPRNQQYFRENAPNLRMMAFGKDVEQAEEREGFPTELTFYETWMHKPRPFASREAIEARNYQQLFTAARGALSSSVGRIRQLQRFNVNGMLEAINRGKTTEIRNGAQMAARRIFAAEQRELGAPLAMMALSVRKANSALRLNPNDSATYRVLATAYLTARELELESLFNIRALYGQNEYASALRMAGESFRFTQVIATYQQSLIRDWSQPNVHLLLAQLYESKKASGLVRAHLRAFLELTEDRPRTSEQEVEQRKQLQEKIVQMDRDYHKAEKEMENLLTQRKPLGQVAEQLSKKGYPNLARELLEEHVGQINNAGDMLRLAQLRLLCGRVEDAYLLSKGLVEKVRDPRGLVQILGAAMEIALCAGRYQEVIQYGEQLLELHGDSMLTNFKHLIVFGKWPLDTRLNQYSQIGGTYQASLFAFPMIRLQIVTAAVESGDMETAKKHLKQFFERYPNSRLRPIAAMYHIAISNQDIMPLPVEMLERIREPVVAPRPASQ